MKDTNPEHQITHVLIEALPYIQQYQGKTMVIKYGGNAMVDNELKNCFAKDILSSKSDNEMSISNFLYILL